MPLLALLICFSKILDQIVPVFFLFPSHSLSCSSVGGQWGQAELFFSPSAPALLSSARRTPTAARHLQPRGCLHDDHNLLLGRWMELLLELDLLGHGRLALLREMEREEKLAGCTCLCLNSVEAHALVA
ncbi:hypothetical protein SEVIR_5G115250v4 [Setaria viridis]|uniref:Secreted protein n=1 Tax=Setaria viridis TaxID=4556 RepID=A0A4U6UCD9_SETVI|nr:hypothetical protein SEVIR_5G115250v2 [Setaria viridis]